MRLKLCQRWLKLILYSCLGNVLFQKEGLRWLASNSLQEGKCICLKKKKSHKQTPTSPHSLYVPKEQHYLIATFCPFFLFFSLKSFREAELLTKLPTYGKNRWISAFIIHWNLKRHKTFQKIKNKTKQRKTPHTVISEGVYPVHYYADFTNISLIKEKAAL